MPQKITRHRGKGSSAQTLPNRSALNSLTRGDPGARSLSNYAKATPSIIQNGPSVVEQDEANGRRK